MVTGAKSAELPISLDVGRFRRSDISGQAIEGTFARACRRIPAGEQPVRAFRGVGGDPIFINRKGQPDDGCDGASYIDYVGSWGPLIFGHGPAL